MIRKPSGYDEAPAYTGEFQQLPKGKYVCVIKQVAIRDSKNGNEQFVILYDIAEGEHKDFYQKMFDADKAQNPSGAKWRGVFKQNMDGKGTPWLKGIITSIERSNNFTFPWDREKNEETLKGKRFGGIFWRRQYQKDDGSRPVITELSVRSGGAGGQPASGSAWRTAESGTGGNAVLCGGWFYEYSGRSRR